MIDIVDFNKKIHLGTAYLASIQEKNGGYISYSSPSKDTFEKSIKFHSVYSSTIILQNLAALPSGDLLNGITKDLAKFITSQQSSICSWNYWVRNSAESKKLPYPDDLDDTFCALTALQIYNPSCITGRVLSCATQLLTATEVIVGGPYKTWIVTGDTSPVWHDTDFVVNVNIAYFLFLQGITLPGLTKYFANALKRNEYTSPYYPDTICSLYFLSRFNRNTALTSILKEKISLLLMSSDPLHCALHVLCLLNLNYYSEVVDQLITIITESQLSNGSWKTSTFYTGVNPNKDTAYYAGSAALTTSFCLNALFRYAQYTSEHKEKQSKDNITEMVVYKAIVNKIRKRFSFLEPEVKLVANNYLDRMLKKDSDKQMTLLPLFFSLSMEKHTKKISDHLPIVLGQASVYGWIAYTIYDDFLDDEPQPECLPLANICLRELTEIFNVVLENNQQFHVIFRETMDKLENANCWEVLNTRFDIKKKFDMLIIPDYGDYHVLADRSMGHALSAIAVIQYTNYKNYLQEIEYIKKFFYHFLIARQLNDDAHDWEVDLQNGQINSVAAQILKKADRGMRLNTQSAHIYLKKIFWQEIINSVCLDIEKHLNVAEAYVKKSEVIQNKKFLFDLLDSQKKITSLTKHEKNKTEEFLSSYELNYSVKYK